MKKNVLITGSNGFIGKNLVEQFNAKYNLFSPTHKELELTDSEAVKNFFKTNEVDAIIHCATAGTGFKGGDWLEKNAQPLVIKQNLQMFYNLVHNLNPSQKLINFGTGAEYDKRFEIKKVKEEDFKNSIPPEDYAFSKYVISKYISNSKENITNLRLFSVFGKYEDYKIRFISKSICKTLLNHPIEIKQDVFFDYLHVNDLANIIDYFIQNNSSKGTYNVGTGTPINLVSIAEKINSIADSPSEIILKQKGLNREYTCDNSRLMKELTNFNFTPIDKSIKELYDYYKLTIHTLKLGEL